jgi:hypothetical protein
MTEKFPEIQSIVDQLLLEQGEYSPVELLLAEGRLSYADYEAWRCGQIATLEEVLAGNAERIIKLLTQSVKYVRLLGLNADRREFFSWGNETGKRLNLSADPAFSDLCSTHYRRTGNEIQLDLFMDNTANVLANGIVDALTSRRSNEADRLLNRLLDTDPSHPRLGALETLCHATQRLTGPVNDYFAESEFLEGCLVALANRELGSRARDYLPPFWRRLADALQAQVFDAERPLLHASYPLACARDWSGVKRSILAEPAWANHAALRCRLADAEFQLGEHRQALAHWCRLCRDFPTEAEQALTITPNKPLQSAWSRYLDLDVEPALDTPFFPAWLLLERADTRDALPVHEFAQDNAASRAYCALWELLNAGSALSERTLELRRQLNLAQPALFTIYKRKILDKS